MRRAAPAILALTCLALLGGCGEDDGAATKDQREAQIACLARAKDIFPQAYSWENQLQEADHGVYGNPYPGEWKAGGAGGDFNWTFTTMETSRMLPAKVVCVGNIQKRQVGGVVYDGTVRKPPEGTIWSY
ncbi:hypothetical protein PQ455_02285 [Sphingomonas naphthae]|uniref:Lipoprotein n=1 Tax=Sphingomonas naphthae TaxID=1813468 RepID=A0ABY7TNV8_9SPHN|nr:hypothetical protein [Sphingomonas naphthae]WCT74080.1 hypothetical protein PQ455_02285 [Sphingomonas naphthae]